MKLQEVKCKVCGGKLEEKNGLYVCAHCGGQFKEESITEQREQLLSLFGELLFIEKEEKVANIRSALWDAVHAEFIDKENIKLLSEDMLNLIQDDYISKFYKTACTGNYKALCDFLNGATDNEISENAEQVICFCLKILSQEILLPLNNYIIRAYEKKNPFKYSEWMGKLFPEAQKIDDGVYDVTIPRDVFIAYKSEDMNAVMELTEYLENTEGLMCFVAARNLQHGWISDYDKKLETAMDNCRTLVFVSTELSRKLGDARKKELPYIKSKDIEYAPSQYKHDYKSIPRIYKKMRVEYVVEGYAQAKSANDIWVTTFFEGYERAGSPLDVAIQLNELIDKLNKEQEELNANKKDAEEREKLKMANEQKLKKQEEEAVRIRKELEERERLNREAEQKLKSKQEELERLRKENARLSNEYKSKKEQIKTGQAKNGKQDFEVLIECANRHYEQENYIEALKLYKIAAEQGFALAQYNLGFCYNTGRGVQKNYLEGVRWYRKAAEQGFALAQCKLGFCYNTGRGVEKNYAEAAKWYKKAADQGNEIAKAQYERLKQNIAVTRPKEQKLDNYVSCPTLENYDKNEFKIEGTVLKKYKLKDKVGEVKIPSGVKSIGNYAFKGCSGLTGVKIPNSVTNIEEWAFWGCSRLTNITIPNSVTSIAQGAFHVCSGLTSVKIPNSITSISDNAFDSCSGLTSVTIPNSVTSIAQGAFEYCSGLTSVTIPNSVTNIEAWAFLGCSRLTSITIPNSVTSIGEEAFAQCAALTIYCEAKKPIIGRPSGWDKKWLGQGKKRPKVVWNCKNKK